MTVSTAGSMAGPTILQIVPELDTGGAELSAVEIGEAVARAGGRALIATEGGRLEAAARAQGAEIIRFPAATKNPIRMLANAQRLGGIIRRENVALVHARSRAPAWSALIAARRAGVAFVTTYHGAYNENGAAKRFYNSVMARADRVIANSQFTADLIRQRYGTEEARIQVIYRGVDRAFDSAEVTAERIAAVRARWGVEEGERIILQAARLTGWKGQSVLIGAVGALAAAGGLGDTCVVLAGDAQGREAYRRQLEAQIAALGLGGQIRLVGHESDMPAAFAAAHVCVVASTEPEAFGRTAAEAQALGCPVVATRLGAPQETVLARPDVGEGDMTGWLVEPDNQQALAEGLAEALALDATLRADMGLRATQHIRTNFSLEQMKRQTLGVYDELLKSELTAGFDRAPTRAFPAGVA